METQERRAYLSDVGDDEWAFVAPHLTLMDDDAPQRRYALREVFNGLRHIVRGGLRSCSSSSKSRAGMGSR